MLSRRSSTLRNAAASSSPDGVQNRTSRMFSTCGCLEGVEGVEGVEGGGCGLKVEGMRGVGLETAAVRGCSQCSTTTSKGESCAHAWRQGLAGRVLLS